LSYNETQIKKKLDNFSVYCKKNGLNVTFQRLAIYRVILEAESNLTPEEVYQKIKKSYPHISLGTVYKTLDVLTEHGFVRRINDLFTVSGYIARTEPEHYMVCRKCKKIIEVPVEAVGKIEVKPEYEELFYTDEITIFFRGLCAECKAKQSKNS
jgi:Fur family peroxide stress response transcriptional regulator